MAWDPLIINALFTIAIVGLSGLGVVFKNRQNLDHSTDRVIKMQHEEIALLRTQVTDLEEMQVRQGLRIEMLEHQNNKEIADRVIMRMQEIFEIRRK